MQDAEKNRAYQKKYRAAHPDKVRALKRKYKKGPAGRAASKRYQSQPHVMAKNRVRAKLLSEKSPEKAKARNIINGLIRYGKLTRQPCEKCGTTKRVHAHHDDYAKPLVVRWLCAVHHKLHHLQQGG